MRNVTLRTSFAATVAAIALVFAACGGGGGNGSPSGGAARISDPAAAPVSERPGDEDQTFVIRDNSVSAPSGATMSLSGDGSTLTGGGGGGGAPGGGGTTYTVQPGDSCAAIANRVEIELNELMAANPQIDADCTNLQPGQELQVPGGAQDDEPAGDEPASDDDNGGGEAAPTQAPAEGGPQTHTVSAGEICGTIADMYGVDVDEMIALNGLDCGNLQIDQVIQIP